MLVILCGAAAATNTMFCLFLGLVLSFLYSVWSVCTCTSVCELARVKNSAPKHFTAPEGHIYAALSQFTS